jgi:cell wall-associated NlpC family hydrolase
VVSPRRTPSGSRRPLCHTQRRPTLRSRLALPTGVALVALLALVLGLSPAAAQPPPPGNAGDAAARLEQVQHEAEALTEEWHAAKDALAARQAELEPLRAAVEPARAAVAAAKADEERYRLQVDAVAMSTFESGNLDQFNALLASGSPQDFLDQMSALELLSADHRIALEELAAVVDRTAQVQADADAAVARAQAAADEATVAEQELAARKRDAEIRIDEAERLLERLTPQERRERNGPDVGGPLGPILGNGAGVQALKAAQTQLGKPYQWGAEGPGSFDCSGLTSWAFEQAGITLPRSSSQQARIGRAVSWDDLQPGDLVFYYEPVSHVGIYAGEGKMINAPQSGDVVKFQKVSSSAFTGARRV